MVLPFFVDLKIVLLRQEVTKQISLISIMCCLYPVGYCNQGPGKRCDKSCNNITTYLMKFNIWSFSYSYHEFFFIMTEQETLTQFILSAIILISLRNDLRYMYIYSRYVHLLVVYSAPCPKFTKPTKGRRKKKLQLWSELSCLSGTILYTKATRSIGHEREEGVKQSIVQNQCLVLIYNAAT